VRPLPCVCFGATLGSRLSFAWGAALFCTCLATDIKQFFWGKGGVSAGLGCQPLASYRAASLAGLWSWQPLDTVRVPLILTLLFSFAPCWAPKQTVIVNPVADNYAPDSCLLTPPLPPPAGWGGEMDERENSWVEIKIV